MSQSLNLHLFHDQRGGYVLRISCACNVQTTIGQDILIQHRLERLAVNLSIIELFVSLGCDNVPELPSFQ